MPISTTYPRKKKVIDQSKPNFKTVPIESIEFGDVVSSQFVSYQKGFKVIEKRETIGSNGITVWLYYEWFSLQRGWVKDVLLGQFKGSCVRKYKTPDERYLNHPQSKPSNDEES